MACADDAGAVGAWWLPPTRRTARPLWKGPNKFNFKFEVPETYARVCIARLYSPSCRISRQSHSFYDPLLYRPDNAQLFRTVTRRPLSQPCVAAAPRNAACNAARNPARNRHVAAGCSRDLVQTDIAPIISSLNLLHKIPRCAPVKKARPPRSLTSTLCPSSRFAGHSLSTPASTAR